MREALDLCLACKGCKSDCPVGVDIAAYKAEFLSHYYHGRLRPAAYAMGLVMYWARLAVARLPTLANFLSQTSPFKEVAKAMGGDRPGARDPQVRARAPLPALVSPAPVSEDDRRSGAALARYLH